MTKISIKFTFIDHLLIFTNLVNSLCIILKIIFNKINKHKKQLNL